MSQIEQSGEVGLSGTQGSSSLEIGGRYRLHFRGRDGKDRVTVGADYIFVGIKDCVLEFSVFFDGRAKGSRRDPMMPTHLKLPEALFNIGVFAEPIGGKPYNEAAVKYNPKEAQDLIAGLPPRLWMFQ